MTLSAHTLSSPCTTLLAARVSPRQVPWPVTAEAVSTSLQKTLRVVFMLTMFGTRGHYNGIGLGPDRPGRPVGTAIGGAGRSFGIHLAIPQHVFWGCVAQAGPRGEADRQKKRCQPHNTSQTPPKVAGRRQEKV